jgi:hypothetical protein
LDQWRGFEEARNSRIMMRSLQLCKVGYTSNRKPSLKLELRSFQNVDTSVWQSAGTTLKSSVCVILFHFVVNKYFRNEFSFKFERPTYV